MKIFILKFLAFYLACFGCSYLQTQFGFSAVLAAAAIGFVGTFYHFPLWAEKKGIHAVFYAGAFAGMCSTENLATHEHIVFISIVGSSLYLLAKPHLNGFGGKLGTISFVSSVCLILTKNLW